MVPIISTPIESRPVSRGDLRYDLMNDRRKAAQCKDRLRARPEPFPNAAEIGRNIEFLTVNARFEPSSNVVST